MEDDKCKLIGNYTMSFNEPGVSYTHVLCCPCCSFFTLSSANLNKHALNHDKEKISSYRTYTCSKCLSLSTERDLMIEHTSIYHRNTKNPVELTEEIHTIIRNEDATVEGTSFETNYINSNNLKETLLPSKSKRSHTKVPKNLMKIKWYSRIKRIKSLTARKNKNKQAFQDLLLGQDAIRENKKVGTKTEKITADEPIDMSVKTQQKLGTQDITVSPNDLPTLSPSSDYPSFYSSIKCHLMDILNKSQLTASLSNPVLMRYLSGHGPFMSTNKYFNAEPYLQRNIVLPNNHISSTNHSVFQGHGRDHHLHLSMSKFQGINSNSCGSSHRSLHRNNFTPFQNHILLEWYDKHKNKPYPSTEDTKHLSALCGLSYPQVKKWFANKRARSTFYQKNELASCHDDDIRCDMIRFPIRVANQLNADIARSMEVQFRKSLENQMPSTNNSVQGSI